MRRSDLTVCLAVAGIFSVPVLAGGGGWVTFDNQTTTRMPTGAGLNDPAITTNDPDEVDYAFGDVDQDGDLDLVIVRKQDFTSTGKRRNILMMNEGVDEGHAINGVLVDRSSDHIPGFLTATNDRDVQLVDVDMDGWLDIVTATTLTDNQSKDLSHPRIYMNQGESGGVWQGYVYESDRIPQMHATAGPRFCSVAFGDLNGDTYPDLYFGDYDSGGSQIFDFNNRHLVNQGAANPGYFTDESATTLSDLFNYPGFGFDTLAKSAFGAASEIADMNGDGTLDVVKQTSLNAPQHVAITHNNIGNQGIFDADDYRIYDSNAPYFVEVGDLNNDGNLDMVVVDDGNDRYYLNTGNDGNGLAQFSSFTFGSISGGFGGNAIIEDLNNDGWNDVIITDVDVDIPGCSRTTKIFRNLGNAPNVSLQVQGQVIPDSMLNGVHDAAVFDINNDGWKDIVMGRCNSTQVWINIPPTGLSFSYPTGTPAFLVPNTDTTVQMQVAGIGGANPEPDTGRLFASIDGGPYTQIAMTHLGGNLYEASLPGIDCAARLSYYFEAELDTGQIFSDPATAPAAVFSAIGAESIDLQLRDEVEGDVSAWDTEADASVTSGFWEAADPNGTISGTELAAPEDDATAGAENVKAWVTDNGLPGETAGTSDLDGGPVRLLSPGFDAEGSDAIVSYARWMFTSGADAFTVDVSNDGGTTWTPVDAHSTTSTGSAWETVSFIASDYVEPTADMRVRFSVSDNPNDSITEAGVDNFQVEVVNCGDATCDITGDNIFDVNDLLAVLGDWGACAGCDADINGDDAVNVDDLLVVLAQWGPCTP